MSDRSEEPSGPSTDSADTSLTVDEMLELLADSQRRHLLEYLRSEADPTVSDDDAVSYVVNQVAEETGRRPNEDEIRVRLQHHHLPRLTDSDLLEYDPRSGTIRYYGNEQLEAFHEHVREFEGE